jgi:Ca2+-binding RTX toxin-like protein
MATFTGTARTANTFVGTAADDLFRFAAADINALDSVTGGDGIDRLQLTSAGILADTALAGVKGVEQIALANGTNAIKLVDANFTRVFFGAISVFGGSGNDRIDASGLIDHGASMYAGAGQDVLLGSNRGNSFYFKAADLAGDTVSGGDGSDRLVLTSGGALAADALAGLSQVETIDLAAGGNAITLLDANFTGVEYGRITVRGTKSGSDVVDASGLSSAHPVLIIAGAGRDVLRGGAGGDKFFFKAADLAGDTVSGGEGSDTLVFSGRGALAADALAGLSHVETIALARGGNAITLLDANFIGVSDGRITVHSTRVGNDVVDASGLSSAHGITVLSGAKRDILRGGGGRDFFSFDAADMAGGTVSGGGNVDTLLLVGRGALAAGALAGLSQVETIVLAPGGNAITMLDANFTGVSSGRIIVRGKRSGNDVVDASGLTGTRSVDVNTRAGLDVLRGGAGNDIFRFKAADLAGDTVVGGLGTDRLVLTTAGALAAGALAKLSGVELIQLAAGGNTLAFTSSNFTGARSSRISVTGSAGNDSLEGSAVGAGRNFVITAGAGLDTLKGGAGADTFRFRAADLAGDTINGGGGADTLQITTAGTLAAGALAQMSRVETITLAAGGNAITLLNANYDGASYATIDDAKIRIIGSKAADTIDARRLDGSRGSNGIDVTAGSGVDRLLGGASRDVFRFAAQDLDGDIVTGGNAVTSIDKLIITTAGALSAGALANVTGVETIMLAAGGNSIVLQNANIAVQGGSTGYIEVIGGAGNDSVDGSALTGLNSPILITAGAGLDTLKGGEGGDTFRFRASDLAGDTVQGGSGSDLLTITTPGALRADALGNVTGIDEIDLAPGGNEITLGSATSGDNGNIIVAGFGGTNRVDAFAFGADHRLTYFAAGGSVQVTGGAGDDQFLWNNGFAFGPDDRVDGGGGYDSVYFNQSMDFLGDTIRNVETLQNNGRVAATVTVSGENAARLLAMGSNSLDGVSTVFYIQLVGSSNSDFTTNLSNLTLLNGDAGDAINVVNSGGYKVTTLSSSIASYTGNDSEEYVVDRGGVQAISLGGGNDTVTFRDGNLFAPGDTIDGGAGDDNLSFDRSMNFLGDSIKNVEILDFLAGIGAAEVTISGEIAAQLKIISLYGKEDTAQIFTVQLTAGSTTDLSKLKSISFSLGDAINVVSHSDNTAVTLNDQFDSFTGSDDNDTVALLVGGAYRSGAVIDGGGGEDRIVYAAGSDTLVLIDGGQEVVLDILSGQVGGDVTVTGFENVDASAATTAVALTGRDDVVSRLVGGSAGDNIAAGLAGAVIVGGLGSDVLNGNSGDDRFHIRSTAEAAGDTIDGLGGSDGIDVFASANLFSAEIRGIETLYLAAGDGAGTFTADNLTATLAAAQAEALVEVYGNGYFEDSVETLVVNVGESGADLSSLGFSYWSGADRVEINGTGGTDIIIGSSQNDVIAGGGGDDRLSGGGGADSFVWNGKAEGGDTITDFEQGTDKLVFTSGQFSVVGAFDTAVDADPGANVDLSSADLVYTGERLNSTADVRSFVDGQNASANHGMFVFALNSADHAILYYSSNASDAPGAVGDTAFYQIADLGTGPFADLSLFMGSFVFV